MPDWVTDRVLEYNGVQMTFRREASSRWPYRTVSCRINGTLVHSETIDNAKWEGHCYGQLLVPEIAQRAHAASVRNSVDLSKDSCEEKLKWALESNSKYEKAFLEMDQKIRDLEAARQIAQSNYDIISKAYGGALKELTSLRASTCVPMKLDTPS